MYPPAGFFQRAIRSGVSGSLAGSGLAWWLKSQVSKTFLPGTALGNRAIRWRFPLMYNWSMTGFSFVPGFLSLPMGETNIVCDWPAVTMTSARKNSRIRLIIVGLMKEG